MFRVRIQSEGILRSASKIPVLRDLVRADIQRISTLKHPEIIDLAFSEIGLNSGVSKQTNKERFADVDKLSVQIITSRSLTRIHDVGISSGITSIELARQLQTSSFDGEMFISDKFARFWVDHQGLSTHIFDSELKLVCTYLGPIIGDRWDTWKFPVSKLLFRHALKKSFDDINKKEFLLLHTDVLETIKRGDLSFIEFDIFEEAQDHTFDFVRCMNLLNRGYFPTEKIVTGLKVLYASLVVGGVLQLGRTHSEGCNHVTFYEKTTSGFRRVESTGQGSEIHELVTVIGKPLE